jgi:rRNA maturation endonuclease Nob1
MIDAAAMLANLESIRPMPGSNKVAVSAADGTTRYLLRCYLCRRMVEVNRRLFGLHDATTCASCQEQLRKEAQLNRRDEP